MAKGVSPKLKVLYLIKILKERTDETHSISMEEILSALESYGITAERKGIYNDFELLEQFGLEVVKNHSNQNCYYRLVTREFELAELKLLVDSVQSAKFISEKKSNDLIKKLESLTSKQEARELQHQVFVMDRVKTTNERVFYNIDAIHTAITKNSQISFQYFYYDENKEMVLKHDGKVYVESPWTMTLAEENYYLICFDENDGIKYFRVDKMTSIKVIEQNRKGKKEFNNFDVAKYSKKRFRMYDGEEKKVRLLCENSLANAVIDRFGKDTMLRKKDEEHFEVCVEVAVSKQFYAWVLALGSGAKIVGPDEVVDELKEYLAEINKLYL